MEWQPWKESKATRHQARRYASLNVYRNIYVCVSVFSTAECWFLLVVTRRPVPDKSRLCLGCPARPWTMGGGQPIPRLTYLCIHGFHVSFPNKKHVNRCSHPSCHGEEPGGDGTRDLSRIPAGGCPAGLISRQARLHGLFYSSMTGTLFRCQLSGRRGAVSGWSISDDTGPAVTRLFSFFL